MGLAMVTPLVLLKNISYDILNNKSLTDVSSLMFTSICKKKVPFPVYTTVLNVKYNEMWRKMKTLLTWYSAIHAVVHEEFLPTSVFRA
jgi:ribonuclease HIII